MNIATECEGKVISRVDGLYAGSGGIVLRFEDGTRLEFLHYQDCCESVYVNDVDGDESDLEGATLLWVEEAVSPEGFEENEEDSWGSRTWTFYRIASSKGVVVVRWLGESNGYYSESVSWNVYN